MSIAIKPGDRIELIYMGNDPNPIEPGTQGTVTRINELSDFTQISVDWDNGRGLIVCLPEDIIRKIG